MRTVSDLLRGKGRDVYSIGPDATVHEALEEMADKNIGAVLVIEDDRLLGILSERDYARKVILHGKTADNTLVREIMTERVFCVTPENNTDECMAIMTEKRVRHLPVLEGKRVTGVVSIGDVVKGIISEQEFVIDQLEQYITGSAFQPPPVRESS
jgi:CBS domain-containing protein